MAGRTRASAEPSARGEPTAEKLVEKYLDTLYEMMGCVYRLEKCSKKLHKLADKSEDTDYELGAGLDHVRDGINELSILAEMAKEIEEDEDDEDEDEEEEE